MAAMKPHRKTRTVARAIVRKWKSIVDVPVEQHLVAEKIKRLKLENVWGLGLARSDRAHGFPKELRNRQRDELAAKYADK